MEITRAELYRLVCEKPLNKVGPELGISGTVLAKLCKQHDVPYPGSGHWTRIAMGMSSVLKPPTGDGEQVVVIPKAQPKRVVVRLATADVPATGSQAHQDEPDPAPAQSMVKQRLLRPHPIVAAILKEREDTRREVLSGRHPYRTTPPPTWSELDRRRHRIMDAVLKELERRGGEVSDTGRGLQTVTIQGEKIEFQIREKQRQVKVPSPYFSNSLRTEHVGTGHLVFAIKTYLRSRFNEEYLDTDRKPLEQQLPRIIDRLFEGAEILKAWEQEREAERERWRQEAERRAELERLAKEEEERWSRFVSAAQAWKEANAITQLISELEKFLPHATR